MPTFEDNNFSLFSNADPTTRAEFRIIGTTGQRTLFGLTNSNLTSSPAIHKLAVTSSNNEFTVQQSMFEGLGISLDEGVGGGVSAGLIINAHSSQSEDIVVIRDSAGVLAFVLNKNGHIPTNTYTLADNTDITKQQEINISAYTTATTRTLTYLDANIVVAGSDTTLTNTSVPVVDSVGRLESATGFTFASSLLTAPTIKAANAAGYKSSDGSSGATGSFTTVDLKTVTVKDGIITAITA